MKNLLLLIITLIANYHLKAQDLIPAYPLQDTIILCAGESHEGIEYFESTIITDTIVFPDFDSIVITNIIILEIFETFINTTSCYQEEAGIYTSLLTAQNGCDSVVIVEVVFTETPIKVIKNELCPYESIIVNGTVYDIENPTGEEILHESSVNGCDSIVGIDLTFFELEEGDFTGDFCQGESILINGTIYDFNNPTGEEIFPNASYTGCDSTLNINLNFISTHTVVSPQLCPGDSIEINGTIYNENNLVGEEFLDVQNQYGCDSILNVNVEMLEDYNIDVNISLNEGDIYNDTQIFNDTLIIESYTSIEGCDSIVNVTVDVLTVGNENILENENSLTLFPNPTKNNEVNIILETSYQADWKIQVMNTLGQFVFSQKVIVSAGINSLKVKDLASGTYFISANREERRLVKKLVVL